MQPTELDPYATLGLDRRCTAAEIRAVFRFLAKQHHPDVNPGSPAAVARIQQINAAHEILSDPERRRSYDRACEARKAPPAVARPGKVRRALSQDVHLRMEELLRGTSLEVRVNDPANPAGQEVCPLTVPAGTAPGTLFRVPRVAPFENEFVRIRVRLQPGFRFKARGADLRCDLRIQAQRAAQGGPETILGATGNRLQLHIPPGVARGQILRLPGEGLPRARGGRGDLLVRIMYRPEVRVSRTPSR